MRALLLILLALAALPASAAYTKIANNGAELPSSASFGSGANDWACTRDNASGLIWEVKTTSGLRSQANTYTNYDSSYGTAGQIADPANSLGLVAAVNAASLCGYGEWRMPGKDELLGLVNLTATPTISATYFPNTPGALFWTATPLASDAASAWDVDFSNGAVYNDARSLASRVRLVRSAPASTLALTVSISGAGSGSVNSGGIACTTSAGTTSGTCTAQRGSGSSVTLSATATGNSVFAGWGGACSGTTPTCTLTLDAAKAVSAAFVVKYYKIAHNGSDLPESALLGSAPDDWGCTRDNTTGLIWEVKTADHGLRDQSKIYTNYDGSYGSSSQIAAASNSLGFATAVNASALCGFSDWRMPGVDELFGLVDTSTTPTINPTYFPNTPSSDFWSGSPLAYGSGSAWFVNFGYGYVSYGGRGHGYRVRLVRGGQSFGTFALRLGASGAGSGTLSADDGSLHCASAAGDISGVCLTSLFNGATVTLTATPASGSGFAGWGGACSASSGPTCSVTMDAAKSVTASFNSGATSQSIAFDPVSSLTAGGTATLRATASSGLAVSIASSTTAICRVSGFTLSAVAAGLCTLTANQAGNASFSPAPQVTQSFSIAAVPLSPPGPPTNIVITPGSGSATLSFSPPSNDGGAPISGYTATCTASGQSTRSASGPSSPLTVRNLTGNVPYQCVLTAANSAGSSPASAALPVTPTPGKKNSLTPILMLLLD